MKPLFWSSLSLVFLAYAGYPIGLYLRSRFKPRAIQRAQIFPSVTVLVAARNEAKNLSSKLQNLAQLEYPADRIEVIVVSDGSTDETNEILASWQKSQRRGMILPEHCGKPTALNCGIAEAQGEIIVFTDVRQMISSDALQKLVANFADPSIGAVSGELIIDKNPNTMCGDGVALYWRIEKKIRYWEGLVESTVGATGAFYAVRKHLLSSLPPETILDDVYIPLQVVRQGQRVVFESRAVAWDNLKPTLRQEFRRKVRTLVGNYQLLQLASWVVAQPNPVRFQFVCHKILRLFVPFALVGLLVSTICLREDIYELALVVQLACYALAAISLFRLRVGIVSRLSEISLAFIILNTAAAIAFLYFVTGKKTAWAR